MTYVSPTPERAFTELEILVELDGLERSEDQAAMCAAFEGRRDFYGMLYDDWISAGAPEIGRAYGTVPDLMHRHLDTCELCQQRYVKYRDEYHPGVAPTNLDPQWSEGVLERTLQKIRETLKAPPNPNVQ